MIGQVLFNSLLSGALYSLVALGYTLIYGVARLINFAHGDVMMIGAYACLVALQRGHVPMVVAIGVAMGVSILAALVVETFAYRPAARTGDPLAPVISTIGVSVIFQSGASLVFGVSSYALPTSGLDTAVRIGSIHTTPAQLLALCGSGLLGGLLLFFLRRNPYGQALRAVADDAGLAETVGIDPKKVIRFAFALSGAMAGLAGVALGLDATLRPTMGYTIGFRGFTSAVLGGIGNPVGAILGSMLIGLVENFAGFYLSSAWIPAYVFGVLVLTLLVRPQGLLPGRRPTGE